MPVQQRIKSTPQQLSPQLTKEIARALQNIRGWGSVEIFIQDYNVVQITERNITKTKHLNGNAKVQSRSLQFAS